MKRTLGKLFTDEYATKCTLTGRGKGIITKIGDTNILNTIKSMNIYVNNLHRNLGIWLIYFKHFILQIEFIKEGTGVMKKQIITDSEFEMVVADWFRYSNTRLSRSSKDITR